MSKTILAAALMVAVLLGAPFAASADGGHGHKAEKPHGDSGDEHHGSAEHTEKKPATPAAAWAELMAARNAIASDIERGELGDIHEKSEPLSGLAKALAEKSGDLESSKRARVDGAVKQVGRVADALHTSADGEDVAKTRKLLKRLDGLLELIKAQYPADSLEAESHGKHGHGEHSSVPVSAESLGAHAHRKRPIGVVDRAPQAVVRVRADDQFRFEPRRIEIQAGVPTQIELANTGGIDHALVVKTPDNAQDWVHIHVPPGTTDRDTYQLDSPGTYALLCTVPGHSEAGMVGELVVLAGMNTALPASQTR